MRRQGAPDFQCRNPQHAEVRNLSGLPGQAIDYVGGQCALARVGQRLALMGPPGAAARRSRYAWRAIKPFSSAGGQARRAAACQSILPHACASYNYTAMGFAPFIPRALMTSAGYRMTFAGARAGEDHEIGGEQRPADRNDGGVSPSSRSRRSFWKASALYAFSNRRLAATRIASQVPASSRGVALAAASSCAPSSAIMSTPGFPLEPMRHQTRASGRLSGTAVLDYPYTPGALNG